MSITVNNFCYEKDSQWNFHDKSPAFHIQAGSWKYPHYIDPFPSYAHDIALVKSEAERIHNLFPSEQVLHIRKRINHAL